MKYPDMDKMKEDLRILRNSLKILFNGIPDLVSIELCVPGHVASTLILFLLMKDLHTPVLSKPAAWLVEATTQFGTPDYRIITSNVATIDTNEKLVEYVFMPNNNCKESAFAKKVVPFIYEPYVKYILFPRSKEIKLRSKTNDPSVCVSDYAALLSKKSFIFADSIAPKLEEAVCILMWDEQK